MAEQSVVLKDKSYLPLPGGLIADIVPVKPYGASIREFEAGDNPKQSRRQSLPLSEQCLGPTMLAMVSRAISALLVLGILAVNTCVAGEGWVVRQDGVGPAKIGMSLPQLNAALHEKFAMPKSKDGQACFYVDTAQQPHILFMIVDGRLARVDVSKAGVRTAGGVQVGDSEERARQVYGSRLKVKPHAYTGPQGHYLTLRSTDGRYVSDLRPIRGRLRCFMLAVLMQSNTSKDVSRV